MNQDCNNAPSALSCPFLFTLDDDTTPEPLLAAADCRISTSCLLDTVPGVHKDDKAVFGFEAIFAQSFYVTKVLIF